MITQSNNANPTTPLLTTIAFLTIPVLFRILITSRHSRRKITQNQPQSTTCSTVRPPFPPVIRSMLSSCRLAYLSTADSDNNSSHLSLMRFTYIQDDELDLSEIIVMSTRRKTKKFEMLRQQGGVALLVHDFPQNGQDDGTGGVYSITLNGICSIVEDGERSERYRAAHLKHNPDYPQFIVGDDIAMLCVDVSTARICNLNDEVTRWSVTDADGDVNTTMV